MLFKKLKLQLKGQQFWGIQKTILAFLLFVSRFLFVSFLLFSSTTIFIKAQDSSKKLKNYISQQIQSSQEQKKSIYSILESLELDIKKYQHLIDSIEFEIPIIKKDIQKKEKGLALVQTKLDGILKQIYQKFFHTYLLEKIQTSSFLPTLSYLQNYPRNKEIITLLLTEEILISEKLLQTAEFRKEQLQKLQLAKNKLQQKKKQIEITTQKSLFEKDQYQLFLKKVEKEQQKNQKIFMEIEKDIDSYAKKSTSKPIFKTKNKKLPVRGKVFQSFGKQNEKISFYHKKGVLIETNANESVRAVTSGKVIFIDKVFRYNYLVILDHGKANFSIYGRLHNVTVKKGDIVAVQQKIASVSPYTKNKHLLYFAMRNSGKSVDPLSWISK